MNRRTHRRELTPAIRALVERVGADVLGTVAFPLWFPDEFRAADINPRNACTHKFLGTTFTRPTLDGHIVGFAYDDLRSGQTDEDLYRVGLGLGDASVTYFPRGAYQRMNLAYDGTHHDPKPYFHEALDPLE